VTPAMGVQLSDQEKIDRAAFHEEVRFYKRQQWAVTTAGVALLGAFLATVRGLHMEAWEKYVAVALVVGGICVGGYFIDDLQKVLDKVRRRLDRFDPNPADRGLPIVYFHKIILTVSAAVVLWALFKGG
jgi:UDP-N-acetylmuramyl pentapeptide phosphotransferase/UDP-N-acetylglucosamine-1-phosphate transferase